jgi:hypothetical protein
LITLYYLLLDELGDRVGGSWFTSDLLKAIADLIEFFQYSLLDLPEKVRARDPLKSVLTGLDEIHLLLNKPDKAGLTAEDVEFLRTTGQSLAKLIGASPSKK